MEENNQVSIVTVGSLLNGKNHFFIPSYQRGYRWSKKQVEDLLSDLYSFKKQYSKDKYEVGDFYCLQPIIVREIIDQDIRKMVLEDQADNIECKLWEVIDGQQRLTSIYILLSYLLNQKGIDFVGFKKRYRAQLFNLFYEARPDTKEVLESLINGSKFADNIDAKHITNAYKYIDNWFDGKGMEISVRYVGGDGETPEVMWDNLLSLITAKTDSESTKVIWYQLGNDSCVDPVEEFTRINNGKIPLTDTELIKALFLQKKNFGNSKILNQIKMSMQWEQMENALQRNDFWCFISNKGVFAEDRMGELLRLVYLRYNIHGRKDIQSGDIFRYYYNQLDGLSQQELQNKIKILWSDIIDSFRTLEDWFESPEIYNYVGYLVQSNVTLDSIFTIYEETKNTIQQCSVDDFIGKLETKIKDILPQTWVKADSENEWKISIEYPDRVNLRKILLLLNVETLSKQLKEIRRNADDNDQLKDVNTFKFPFDLYSSQKWDIEHIDSATTNDLTDKAAQEAWVRTAIEDIHLTINEDIQKKMENGEWKDLIGIIQQNEEEDSENKNYIGNLTLLDSGTNREYKNALFCQKRSEIIKQVKNGRYILPCTLYVFMKFFDGDIVTESRTKWTRRDQENYHDYIWGQLKRFSNIK